MVKEFTNTHENTYKQHLLHIHNKCKNGLNLTVIINYRKPGSWSLLYIQT